MSRTETGGSERRTGWLIAGMLLALLGFGAALYSTMHHLDVKATGQTDAACNINETFNCDEVALSQYSEIAGVPLGVVGLGYFVALLVVLGIALAGGKSAKDHAHAYVVMVGVGVLVSAALAGISIGVLGAYCLACVGIYAVSALQAILVWLSRRQIPGGWDMKGVGSSGVNAAIAVAAVIAVFNLTRPVAPAPKAADAGQDLPALADKTAAIPLAKSAYSGLGEDYRKGNDEAAVVIQEFADFQCPACQRVAATVDAIAREFEGRVLIVFRNYPLDPGCNSAVKGKIHEHACEAAVMARCAGQYGKFWEYHDRLFANQSDISEARLKDWARQLGLTNEQVEACWASQDLLAKVQDDITLANRLGVSSTPTLFINGRQVLGGRGLAELRTEIEQLLN